MKSNIHNDRQTRRKQTLENANSGEVRGFTINNRFCYYWNPEDDRDNKDVIIIEDNVTGYYETNYPRMDKAQIMKMTQQYVGIVKEMGYALMTIMVRVGVRRNRND